MRLALFLEELTQLVAPCAPKRIVQREHDAIVDAVAVIGDSSQHHWCKFVRPALGSLQEGREILAGGSEEKTNTAVAVIEALKDGSMKIEQLAPTVSTMANFRSSSSETSSRVLSEETKASERASCAKRFRI